MRVEIGASSHTGQVRSANQDSFGALLPPDIQAGLDAVLVVADGMGGHRGGEVASQLAVRGFLKAFGADGNGLASAGSNGLIERIAAVIVDLSRSLLQTAAADPELRGMGTTTTAIVIASGRAYIGHVGDSRAYLIRNHDITRLTIDHSWVANEVREGRMTEEEAKASPRRNILLQAVGSTADPVVHVATTDLRPNDALVICSDGLHNMVTEAEIATAVTNVKPHDAAEHLVAIANERGAPDNVTVVVALVAPNGVASADRITEQSEVTQPGQSNGFAAVTVPPSTPVPNANNAHASFANQETSPSEHKGSSGRLFYVICAIVIVVAAIAAAAVLMGWFR